MSEFKRWFYETTKTKINQNYCTFLLGPRKCGKTICMKQILNDSEFVSNFEDVFYMDLKTLSPDKREKVIAEVIESAQKNENKLFLIDEITYADFPDLKINDIAGAQTDVYARGEKIKTRILISGSQSYAMGKWARAAFSGLNGMVEADFLQFNEWISYKNLQGFQIGETEDAYNEFLLTVNQFYHMETVREYVAGCLEETVISNAKAADIIHGNSTDGLTADILLDVLYASMIPLHNQSVVENFSDSELLKKKIRNHFKESYLNIGEDEINIRLNTYVGERYKKVSGMDYYTFKQAIMFLYQIGLITLTYTGKDEKNSGYVYEDMCLDKELGSFPDLEGIKLNRSIFLRHVIIDVSYPMFVIAMIKDVLKENMPKEIPNDLKGSVLECHLRKLLPETSCMEFQFPLINDGGAGEVDYINSIKKIALEFTASYEKSELKLHFTKLPEGYHCALICGSSGTKESCIKMPYYEVIPLLEKNMPIEKIIETYYEKGKDSPKNKSEDDPNSDDWFGLGK